MIKKLFVFILILLHINISFAQYIDDIKIVCKKGDYESFSRITDSLMQIPWNKNSWPRIHSSIKRTITAEFNEVIFEMTERYNSNEDKNYYINYTINIVQEKDDIIYCEINDSLYIKSEEKLKDLQKLLKNSYNNKFQIDELFKQDIVYGKFCGISGAPPKMRDSIENLINRKDTAEINKMLISLNTETQIYGLEAIFRLESSGMNLTAMQKKIIKNILMKKGNIRVCEGCLRYRKDINQITDQFNFKFIEY